MVERIRRIAPQLPLFLTGGCWSNIEGIVQLDTDLLHDRHNFVSVHFYYPFLFTHQSATWSMPYLAGTIGVPYPASAGSLAETLELTRARFRTVKLPDGADRAAAEAQGRGGNPQIFRRSPGTGADRGLDEQSGRLASAAKVSLPIKSSSPNSAP